MSSKRSRLGLLVAIVFLSACGSKFLHYDKEHELKKMDEFEKKVDIVISEDTTSEPTGAPITAELKPEKVSATPTPTPGVSGKKAKKKKEGPGQPGQPGQVTAGLPGKSAAKPTAKSSTPGLAASEPLSDSTGKKGAIPSLAKKGKKEMTVATTSLPSEGADRQGGLKPHLPDIEPSEGFDGRRPLRDPFRVGEKVVHAVRYFAVSAGSLTMEVKPYAQVNGRKSYHFQTSIKTSDWYSGIYSVDDRVSVMVDFDTLVPSIFQLHVRETGQLKEARMLFEKGKAFYWERKVTKQHGEEEEKFDWDILEYSQNLFSAVNYMRVFDWKVGQEVAFRVSDDRENLIFRGKAVRKELLKTDAGDFNTVVVQPQVELKGKYKPVGDIFIWLSDDDRKLILKIEAHVRIGTLVSEAIEVRP